MKVKNRNLKKQQNQQALKKRAQKSTEKTRPLQSSKGSSLSKELIRVGVVVSRFNEEITSKLEQGALEFLENAGFEVLHVRVPGAVEIPLACKALMEAGCEGVVACGAVIRGETSHYDVVCNSVERGVTQLMLQTGKPIGFGVITTENEEQAQARAGGAHGNKGQEAAQVMVEMLGLLKGIRSE